MAGQVLRGIALAVIAVMLVVGCSSADKRVQWRELSLEVPDGWVVAERDDRKLSIANTEFGPGQADELEAAVFLTHEPGAAIDGWRDLVDERDGTVVSDGTVTVDGEPANRLVFDHDANGTPLREMVVVVPSRDVVMLFQPIVLRGSGEGEDTFQRYADTFERVLATVGFDGAGGGGSPPPELSRSGRS